MQELYIKVISLAVQVIILSSVISLKIFAGRSGGPWKANTKNVTDFTNAKVIFN